MKKIFLTLTFGSAITLSSFAQSINLQEAIKEYKQYNPMKGIEPAKKIVNSAKYYIDLAAVHPETAEDMKMHLYRGEIYFSLIELMSMDVVNGKELDTTLIRGYSDITKSSFMKVMNDKNKRNFKPEVLQFINPRVEMAMSMGINLFNEKKYEQASQAFLSAYEIKKFIGEDFADAYKNASVSVRAACDSLTDKNEFDKATKLAEEALEIMPKNIDILICLININIVKGDAVKGQEYINQALAIDPLNKQLYSVLGTLYIDLKQNEKAEETLIKALEIDPDYSDVQYQLGAHLLNWGQEILNEANNLDYRNPKVQELDKKAKEILLRGATILEKYIEKKSDKEVLKNLEIIYRLVGDTEKAAQFKKRADAIK